MASQWAGPRVARTDTTLRLQTHKSCNFARRHAGSAGRLEESRTLAVNAFVEGGGGGGSPAHQQQSVPSTADDGEVRAVRAVCFRDARVGLRLSHFSARGVAWPHGRAIGRTTPYTALWSPREMSAAGVVKPRPAEPPSPDPRDQDLQAVSRQHSTGFRAQTAGCCFTCV